MAGTEGVIPADDLSDETVDDLVDEPDDEPADDLIDDLDGSTEDVAAVWIELRAQRYELNLNAEHRQHLLAVLGPFIDRARLIADTTGDQDPPPVEVLPPRRRRRPSKGRPARSTPRPGRGGRASARREPGAALVQAQYTEEHLQEHSEEHPDYPWFPLHRVEQALAAKVRAWAVGQGIVMPDRGTPRSVLRAYYRRDLRGATSAGGCSGR